jgi:nucleoside permease NupC
VVTAIGIGRRSDVKMERRWHLTGCAFIGGAALVMIAATASNLALALVALAIATATIFTGVPLFFATLTSYLSSIFWPFCWWLRVRSRGTAASGSVAGQPGVVIVYEFSN